MQNYNTSDDQPFCWLDLYRPYTLFILAVIFIGCWSLAGSANAATLVERSILTESNTHPIEFQFKHPGVLVNLDQLKFAKARVAAGENPWKATFDDMQASLLATRVPDISVMQPAPGNAGGKVLNCNRGVEVRGCKNESTDAAAAYTQALLWFFTENETYAQRAVVILDAYSGNLIDHIGVDGPLFAAWAAQYFTRAAEILRYTYTPSSGKKNFDLERFNNMLNKAFLPSISDDEKAKRGKGSWKPYNSNWDTAAIDALANIGVFTNDGALFFSAVERWKDRVRRSIYLASDGSAPIRTPFIGRFKSEGCAWIENRVQACCHADTAATVIPHYQSGQTSETCRDFPHAGIGLASIVNAAETAWIQGVDLYSVEKERIMSAFSYASQILLYYEKNKTYPRGFCSPVATETLATGVNSSTCSPKPLKSGPLNPLGDGGRQSIASEIAYNAYVIRGGEKGFPVLDIPNYSLNGIPMLLIRGARTGSRDFDPLRTAISRYRGNQGQLTENYNAHVTLWETLTHHEVGDGTPNP
ncbi:Alginate lyase [Methylobacillus rhizosphaerae]|uniref:Alginate lyase n=1 Tax=Methylobacillus rhizosphaerae TaxID=551994 RepID=A0A239AZ21_9PROT|nr:alginate lyase family protein [Methylobacillus rhizosphaerae]SNS00955.1 Alginate lyase [Methylobacillus rhizosphaerae]